LVYGVLDSRTNVTTATNVTVAVTHTEGTPFVGGEAEFQAAVAVLDVNLSTIYSGFTNPLLFRMSDKAVFFEDRN